jgi:hypothetical protein
MVLMLFIILAFAFLGLGGLTIDMGMTRLTHLQMRNGVEAAAMEGLRMTNAASSETERRSAARDVMLWVYDDDFDPSSGDAWQHGAGPIYELSGGTDGARALQKLDLPDVPVFRPDPQLNLPNEMYGDMVDGRYLLEDLEHYEASNYARTDFIGIITPLSLLQQLIAYLEAISGLPPGIGNSLSQRLYKALEHFWNIEDENELNAVIAELSSFISETEAQRGKHLTVEEADFMIALAEDILALLQGEDPRGIPAFLVRLRRTRDPTDPTVVTAIDAMDGVSSSGTSISYLLGRGSLIDNSRRRDGVKVRATAIAAARQATSVGRASTVFGATPFALEYEFWNTMAFGSYVLRADEDDDLNGELPARGLWVERRAWSIGSVVTPRDTAGPVAVTEVFVPIYAQLDVPRVVGFGIVETFPHPHGVRIRRRSRAIAPTNASAASALGLAGLPDTILRAVLDRNRSIRHALLAPVLVR